MNFAIWLAGTFVVVTVSVQLASIALVAIRIMRAKRRPAPTPAPRPVTVLRPVCGLDHKVEETLRSTFLLDWPDYEIIFCCASAADPVVPLVEKLIEKYPRVQARLLTGDDRISINPKLNNLVKGWSAARHEWIVMADSNILLPSDYIATLLARWIPGTGLVGSPAVGDDAETFGAEIECAFLNTYQGRWQLAADTVGLGFAQGKTMLWRRDILDAAGGIRGLASEPAEDAAATKIVRRAGLKVRLSPQPFVQPLGQRSFRSVWDRQLRWARLRRATFKLFFAPELISGGFFPMLAAAFLAACEAIATTTFLGFAAVWYGAEALLARVAGWRLSALSIPAWIARDILIPPLWVAAWAGNSFVWRGNPMCIQEPDTDRASFFRRVGILGSDGSLGARWTNTAALARRWYARKNRNSD